MKLLAKLLSPLSTLEYTVKSTKVFTEKLRTVKVPKGYQMVSFDVKALFTNIPLEYSIDLVLKRICENHEIFTSITRNEMREILLLCAKKVHFPFRDVVYLQTDGVAMGSPLGTVLAGIFMVYLERSLVPLLTARLSFWKRYVDDTITFVKIGTVDHILSMLKISILIFNSHTRQNVILNQLS